MAKWAESPVCQVCSFIINLSRRIIIRILSQRKRIHTSFQNSTWMAFMDVSTRNSRSRSNKFNCRIQNSHWLKQITVNILPINHKTSPLSYMSKVLSTPISKQQFIWFLNKRVLSKLRSSRRDLSKMERKPCKKIHQISFHPPWARSPRSMISKSLKRFKKQNLTTNLSKRISMSMLHRKSSLCWTASWNWNSTNRTI